MIELRASVKTGAKELSVGNVLELDETLSAAETQARAAGILGGIKLRAPNGDELLLVVGGDETVLGFNRADGDPPYYASHGAADTDLPYFTAYIGLTHHTEFPRRHVVPIEQGRSAAFEFLRTGARPTSVRWVET